MPHPSPHFVDESQAGRNLLRALPAFALLLPIVLLSFGQRAAFGQGSDANDPLPGLSQQSPGGDAGSPLAAPGSSAVGDEDRDSLPGNAGAVPFSALPASQIDDILERNPDLMTELKSQLAERLGQQGIEVDPDNISDRMIYNQVATSPSFRTNITAVLRARGYETGGDLLP